jgi:hypothetical protein
LEESESFLDWKAKEVKERKGNLKPVKKSKYDFTREPSVYRYVRPTIKTKRLRIMDSAKGIDLLKYYSIVSYSFCKKNKITKDVFEFLLHLYSEPPMTRYEFNEVLKILPVKSKRLKYFVDSGFITETEPIKKYDKSPVSFFAVSQSMQKCIHHFYMRLLKHEKMTEDKNKEVLFYKNISVLDKNYAEAILKMNRNDNDNFNNYKVE